MAAAYFKEGRRSAAVRGVNHLRATLPTRTERSKLLTPVQAGRIGRQSAVGALRRP